MVTSGLSHYTIINGEAHDSFTVWLPGSMGDTGALLAAGWRLSSCQAVFFFPGTDSIETLAVFDR
jgi:hypothetical protein